MRAGRPRSVARSAFGRAALAVALAYALALQALLASFGGALALGLGGEGPHALCSPQGSSPGGNPGERSRHDLCCTLGCQAAPLAAPSPQAARLPAPRLPLIVGVARGTPALPARARPVFPVGARAPPPHFV